MGLIILLGSLGTANVQDVSPNYNHIIVRFCWEVLEAPTVETSVRRQNTGYWKVFPDIGCSLGSSWQVRHCKLTVLLASIV